MAAQAQRVLRGGSHLRRRRRGGGGGDGVGHAEIGESGTPEELARRGSRRARSARGRSRLPRRVGEHRELEQVEARRPRQAHPRRREARRGVRGAGGVRGVRRAARARARVAGQPEGAHGAPALDRQRVDRHRQPHLRQGQAGELGVARAAARRRRRRRRRHRPVDEVVEGPASSAAHTQPASCGGRAHRGRPCIEGAGGQRLQRAEQALLRPRARVPRGRVDREERVRRGAAPAQRVVLPGRPARRGLRRERVADRSDHVVGEDDAPRLRGEEAKLQQSRVERDVPRDAAAVCLAPVGPDAVEERKGDCGEGSDEVGHRPPHDDPVGMAPEASKVVRVEDVRQRDQRDQTAAQLGEVVGAVQAQSAGGDN